MIPGTLVRWFDKSEWLGRVISPPYDDGVECWVTVEKPDGSIVTACVGHLSTMKGKE